MQRRGRGTATTSLSTPPLPVLSPMRDDFTAPLLSVPWALPYVSTPSDQSRKDSCHCEDKNLHTSRIFAGLQLLHTVDLEAVNGVPIIHRPVDGNGGTGGWVWFLRYNSWCLWDWEESFLLLFTLTYFQPNNIQVRETTWLLICFHTRSTGASTWNVAYWSSFRAMGPKLGTEKSKSLVLDSAHFSHSLDKTRFNPEPRTEACAYSLPRSWGPTPWGRTIVKMSHGMTAHFWPSAGRVPRLRHSWSCRAVIQLQQSLSFLQETWSLQLQRHPFSPVLHFEAHVLMEPPETPDNFMPPPQKGQKALEPTGLMQWLPSPLPDLTLHQRHQRRGCLWKRRLKAPG